jgi:hypothetical protein
MNIDDTLADDLLPTDEEWNIIKQICECLHTMAKFQQVLEGGKFVTASLVSLAVFNIRARYRRRQLTRKRRLNLLKSFPRSYSKTLMNDTPQRMAEK